MRAHQRIILAAVLLLVAAAQVGYAETEVGRLAVVNGDVRVSKGNDAGRLAKPNDALYNSDTIKTGNGAAAKMLFTDQSVMDIGPNSALKVSDYALKDGESRTGTLSLMYGKLRALVTKKVGPQGNVEVRTGNAVMGVRGTEFMVDSPRGGGAAAAPTLLVVSGSVACRPPGGGPSISVGAGQMLVANRAAFAQAAASSAAGASKGGGTSKDAGSKDGSGKAGGAGETANSGGSTGVKEVSFKSDGVGVADSGSGSPVVKVSADQMATMMGSAKAEDHTFVNAVTIAPANSSGGGQSSTSSSVMTLMMAEAKSAGNTAQAPPPTFSAPPPPPLVPVVNIVPGNRVHLSVNVQ